MSVSYGDTSQPAVLDGPREALGSAFAAVLEAVLAESPPAALDTVLHRLDLAAEGLDLSAVAVAAHRAASQAQTRRRRELSLLALSEAVETLGQHSEVGRLHQAIVETVPRLVPGVDSVWLSVRDDDGWRESARSGPAGGLNTVLAVPLLVGAVLHVARRERQPLAADDTGVVHRFARAAAARLEVVTALSESERRGAALATRLRDLDRITALGDALLDLAAAPEPPAPDTVAGILAAGLDAEVVLLDARPADANVPADLVRRALAEPDRVAAEPGAYAVAVVASGRPEGTICVLRRRPLTGDETAALRRAARLVANLHGRRNAVLEAYEQLRADLLTELLSSRRALTAPVRILAEARDFPLDRTYVVVAVAGDSVPDRVVADAAALLGGLGGRYAGLTVALVPADEPRAAAEAVAARIRRATGTSPGMCASDPVEPAAGGLPAAFEAARHGLALLRAAGSPNRAATTNELALYRPLFDPERSGDVHDLLDAALRPLLEYERDYKVDLVETVRVFLATGCNASKAARRLYIHPNTMTKRLERITQLLGDGWPDGVNGLRLRLALHLRSLGADPSTSEAA
nr:helix-turn-helix domain-containing protein [uncultured Actinoplanes sp.]